MPRYRTDGNSPQREAMTQNDQHNKDETAVEILSVLDEIQQVLSSVTTARARLGHLFERGTDEEERLALYHMDMTLTQLDMLAVHIARKMRS